MISVRETLSHGGLRKGNPDSKVITGFYRSPGIAVAVADSLGQLRREPEAVAVSPPYLRTLRETAQEVLSIP